jgi:hypothetical protein
MRKFVAQSSGFKAHRVGGGSVQGSTAGLHGMRYLASAMGRLFLPFLDLEALTFSIELGFGIRLIRPIVPDLPQP